MSGEGDAVARWAAAHAATIPAGRVAAPPSAPGPSAEPVPAVLSAFTEVRTWEAGDEVSSVAWGQQPDGSLVLAVGGLNSGRVSIWDADSGEHLRTFAATDKPVRSVAWGHGADGEQILAAAHEDGTAVIMDATTGDILRELTTHDYSGTTVAWGHQPDGRLLLATAEGYGVRIWDPDAGEFSHSTPGLGFAWGNRSDGSPVLAIGEHQTMRIWDPRTRQTLFTLSGRSRRHEHDTQWFFTWGRRSDGHPVIAIVEHDSENPHSSGTLWVWAWDSPESSAVVLDDATDVVFAMSWAPPAGGRVLLATSAIRALQVWDGHADRLLHTQPVDSAPQDLDWALTRDGRLLLAGAGSFGRVHVWEAVLDPPVTPPPVPSTVPSHGSDRVRHPRPGVILDPPEDVTPAFAEGRARNMEVFNAPDGRILIAMNEVASGPGHRSPRVLDLGTGEVTATLASSGEQVNSVAWGCRPGGRPFVAFGNDAGDVWICDAGSGQRLRTLSAGRRTWATSVACANLPDGEPLLASGYQDGTVRIWDPGSGTLVRSLTGHQEYVWGVSWTRSPDGRPLLASGGGGQVNVWDETGELLRTLTTTGGRGAVAWVHDGGTPLLAAACDDSARVWNAVSGELVLDLTMDAQRVWSVAWASGPDGRPLLATVSGGTEYAAQIWDGRSGEQLGTVPGGSGYHKSAAWATSATGDLLLLVAAREDQAGPMRVWRVATGLDDVPADTEASPGGRAAGYRPGELAGWLLRLGGAGLWLPLGLIADLVELTGPQESCRLDALRSEAGVTRLRELGWPPTARLAFGALLTSTLAIPDQYTPPSSAETQPGGSGGSPPRANTAAETQPGGSGGSSARASTAAETQPGDSGGSPARPGEWGISGGSSPRLREALTRALADGGGVGGRLPVPVADLRAAMAAVTDRTVTLLSILGPAACAVDPLLPARLAHRIPQLPALSSHELRLLTAAGERQRADGQAQAAGMARYSPGTAGLARTGSVTRLLPTQLALPRDVMTMRLAENLLLYREHRAPAPAATQPVTIILDTTPPTFGPAGHVLRLAAHLITTVLWEFGHSPCLITLTEPGRTAVLRSPADLIGLWASSTLRQPAPALETALVTAAAVGEPVVLCTHHHTPAGVYAAGPSTRLLTAHHTPERPPPSPASPWHCHLSPDPAKTELDQAVTRLLARHAEDGN